MNEQWPEYWARLFAQHGYVVADAIRRRVWDNPAVEPYYAQNILLFCDRAALATNTGLQAECARAEGAPLARVHPRQYMAARDLRRRGLGAVVRALPGLVAQAIRRRLGGSAVR